MSNTESAGPRIENDGMHPFPVAPLAACPLCGRTSTTVFLSAPDRFHLRRQEYELMRCSSCDGVWLVSPPSPKEMLYHYDDGYHAVIEAGGDTFAEKRWRLQRQQILKYKKTGAILDIGCSSGGFLRSMQSPGWTLYGIEISPKVAAKARTATGAQVFVGDAVDAPFGPASFDVITSFDLLEHVYDPHKLLAKVLDWLKPGGLFYVVLPNITSWEAEAFGSYWYGLELPRHLFHFSPGSLRYLLTSVGFEELSLRTPTTCYVERSLGYLTAEALKKLGIAVSPQSEPKPESFAWRATRKVLRMTVISAFGAIASLAGAGGSMEAIFRKPFSCEPRGATEGSDSKV